METDGSTYFAIQDLRATLTGTVTRPGGVLESDPVVARTRTTPVKPLQCGVDGPAPIAVFSILEPLQVQAVHLILLSLELWTSGFIIRFASYDDSDTAARPIKDSLAQWVWTLHDTLGSQYAFVGASIHSGLASSVETGEWRFTPALNPEEIVTVTVEEANSRLFQFAISVAT